MTQTPEQRCRHCGAQILEAKDALSGELDRFDRRPDMIGEWHLTVHDAPVSYDRRHDASSPAFGVRRGLIEELVAIRDPNADVRYRLHSETCRAPQLWGAS